MLRYLIFEWISYINHRTQSLEKKYDRRFGKITQIKLSEWAYNKTTQYIIYERNWIILAKFVQTNQNNLKAITFDNVIIFGRNFTTKLILDLGTRFIFLQKTHSFHDVKYYVPLNYCVSLSLFFFLFFMSRISAKV